LLLDSFLSLHAQQQHYSKLKRVLTLPHAFYIRARVVPRFLSQRDSRDICLQIPMGCSFPFLWNSPGLRGFSIPDPRAASRNSTPAENSDIKLKGQSHVSRISNRRPTAVFHRTYHENRHFAVALPQPWLRNAQTAYTVLSIAAAATCILGPKSSVPDVITKILIIIRTTVSQCYFSYDFLVIVIVIHFLSF